VCLAAVACAVRCGWRQRAWCCVPGSACCALWVWCAWCVGWGVFGAVWRGAWRGAVCVMCCGRWGAVCCGAARCGMVLRDLVRCDC